MKSVIERLRKQTSETNERAWKLGAREARRWLTFHARHYHLRQIGEGKLTFDKPSDNVMGFLCHYYPGGYFRTEQDDYDDYEYERSGDVEAYNRGFNQGFVEVVKQAWEEIAPALG